MQKSIISVFPMFFISAQLYALRWNIIFWKKFSFFIDCVAVSKKLAKLIFLCPFVKQKDRSHFLKLDSNISNLDGGQSSLWPVQYTAQIFCILILFAE